LAGQPSERCDVRWPLASWLLPLVLMVAAAMASRILIKKVVHGPFSNLTVYATWVRFVPFLITLACITVSSIVMGLIGKIPCTGTCKRSGARESTLSEHGAEMQVSLSQSSFFEQPSLQVTFGRLDVGTEMQHAAMLQRTLVRACGPDRLLKSVRDSIHDLKRRNFDVNLDHLEQPL